jgi:stress response protein SCP2
MYSNAAREIVADPEMFRSWATQATRQGTIDRVDIVDSTVAESQTEASVDFDITFHDGSTAAYSVELVDEGGEWKLGLVVPR